jgi:two-component system CheB/CheR fusion protein
MVRLIDDLLDVSRISRGRITLRKERVVLAELVERALETAGPLLEARGHEVTISLPSAPLHLEADATRLIQVVANLLNNASKFTEVGGRITVTAEPLDGDVVVRVRDTGIGFPAELVPRMFDLFVQGDASLDRRQGGLGIGLTVVRRLVELHDGTIEARSEGPGRGSEFIVRLPALPSGPPAGADEAPEPAASRPLRILVVEDNVDAAESLRTLLELGGHDVRVAHTGAEALELTERFTPSVAFIDIGLPGVSGYELAPLLRRDRDLRNAVLVALTGYGQDEDKRRAHQAGFDHHLTKPLEFAQLEALLATIASTGPGAQDGPTLQ